MPPSLFAQDEDAKPKFLEITSSVASITPGISQNTVIDISVAVNASAQTPTDY